MMTEKIFSRILEAKLQNLLSKIGCVVIEGPKQSGKTFLGAKFSQSQFYVQENGLANQSLIGLDYDQNPLFNGPKPKLIDEWQIVPAIWDKVRFLVDQSTNQTGLFILTASINPNYELVHHSGAGRMAWLNLATLTFSEILPEQTKISLKQLFTKQTIKHEFNHYNLNWVAKQLIQGGWPYALAKQIPSDVIIESYLTSLIKVNTFNKKRIQAIKEILVSLARLNGTQLKLSTILNDIKEQVDPRTLTKYLNHLRSFYLLFDLEVWNPIWESRSKTKLRITPKTYWCDPSLGLNLLKIKHENQLFNNLKTLGIYFENQVIKDLSVYAQALDGQLYFYRDANGLEVDAIIELNDGSWAAFEIKLGPHQIEQAAKKLLHFAKMMQQKKPGYPEPKFLMIITTNDCSYQRTTDGIYVVPHPCLGI